MKIKIIKIIIVIYVIIWWLGRTETAEAIIKRSGEIEVITDEPMFADSIVWYPGLRVERSFQVKNRGGGAKTVQIETENESEISQLAQVLTIQVKEGAREIFGVTDSKTLKNFFDSAAITLAEVFGDDGGKTFSAAVTMSAGAGNEYQGARAKFDLRIGFVGDSSSTVTVAGESSGVLGESGKEGEGKEGTEGQEGERQNQEGEGQNSEGEEGEGREGSGGLEGGRQSPGEVAGAEAEGINWKLLAIIGGILGIGGLAGWAWWRRSR